MSRRRPMYQSHYRLMCERSAGAVFFAAKIYVELNIAMNKYVAAVLLEFRSPENAAYLRDALSRAFGGHVDDFIANNIDSMIWHFAAAYEHDMSVSEPFMVRNASCNEPGAAISIYEQVNALNSQFLTDRAAFIKTHLLNDTEVPTAYIVRDSDIPTSRNNLKHYQSSPDNILKSWYNNASHAMTARDDTHNDHSVTGPSPYYAASAHDDPLHSAGMRTGIVFCDQSEIGQIEGSELIYGDKMFNVLNDTARTRLYDGAFGQGVGDERLMQRRVFRSNEAGVENGIPHYEQRLYRRQVDRDVRESLSGVERGCAIYKHDMSSLFKRVDRQRKKRYDLMCNSPAEWQYN